MTCLVPDITHRVSQQPYRPLPALSCPAKDLILNLSLELEDLDDACRAAHVIIPVTCRALAQERLLDTAHRLCHESPGAAGQMEQVLMARHAGAVQEVRHRTLSELAPLLPRYLTGAHIGAYLWAILSDPRPEFEPLEPCLVRRVQRKALRLLRPAGAPGPGTGLLAVGPVPVN